MPEWQNIKLDPVAVATDLNKLRKLRTAPIDKGSERTRALRLLPDIFPLPIRFIPHRVRFTCKKCGFKGKTKVFLSPELSAKGKRDRCMCLLIPFPICMIVGCCMLCEDNDFRQAISDVEHVCPKCGTEAARCVYGPAIEVTPQEVAEALERMKTDPKYGRFF